MLCLSDFELYSRWVPLSRGSTRMTEIIIETSLIMSFATLPETCELLAAEDVSTEIPY